MGQRFLATCQLLSALLSIDVFNFDLLEFKGYHLKYSAQRVNIRLQHIFILENPCVLVLHCVSYSLATEDAYTLGEFQASTVFSIEKKFLRSCVCPDSSRQTSYYNSGFISSLQIQKIILIIDLIWVDGTSRTAYRISGLDLDTYVSSCARNTLLNDVREHARYRQGWEIQAFWNI